MKLTENLQPEREASRNPMISTILGYHPFLSTPFSLGDLEAVPYSVDMRATRFDLEVHFTRRGDILRGVFYYSTDLFEASTIARLADNFLSTLELVAQNPEFSVHSTSVPRTAEDRVRNLRYYLESSVPAVLPLDNIRSSSSTPAHETHGFRISKAMFLGLGELATKLSVALEVVLVTAFRVLHFRYTNIEDAAIGMFHSSLNPLNSLRTSVLLYRFVRTSK